MSPSLLVGAEDEVFIGFCCSSICLGSSLISSAILKGRVLAIGILTPSLVSSCNEISLFKEGGLILILSNLSLGVKSVVGNFTTIESRAYPLSELASPAMELGGFENSCSRNLTPSIDLNEPLLSDIYSSN